MAFTNKFGRLVNKVNKAPAPIRSFLLTKMFCSHVKLANTAKVKIHEISEHHTLLTLANRKPIQNHIGGIHAVAAALIAESATGIIVGVHLPDSKVPVIKSMTVNYQRRMQGALTAKAQISDEQIEQLLTTEKGDTIIPVQITDESGQEPITCEMHWAWVSKNR